MKKDELWENSQFWNGESDWTECLKWKNKMKFINYGNFEKNHEQGFELSAKYSNIWIESEIHQQHHYFCLEFFVLEVMETIKHIVLKRIEENQMEICLRRNVNKLKMKIIIRKLL